VSNTEFEGGDDGHDHGEGTFLVKQAQPSHERPKQVSGCPIRGDFNSTYETAASTSKTRRP
jgi:hypothetical protein